MQPAHHEHFDTLPSSSEHLHPPVHRFEFEGVIKEMFLIALENLVLTVFTFGIYRFWGKTRFRKYIWSHTKFAGDRLEYTGTAKELYTSASKIAAFVIVFWGLSVWLRYLEATSGAGKLFSSLVQIFPAMLFLIVPFVQYSSRNYRLSRTRWRNIRMGMTPERLGYIRVYLGCSLLSFLSLGLCYPLQWHLTTAYLVNNTKIGNQKFSYVGKLSEVWGRYLLNALIIGLTLGLYYPWHVAWRERYKWKHTRLMEARFKLVVTGEEVLLRYIFNFVVFVLTSGLAFPYLLHYNISFFTERLALVGDIDFSSLEQGNLLASADGEELAEFMDVDIGF